jgi:hypothetical protein
MTCPGFLVVLIVVVFFSTAAVFVVVVGVSMMAVVAIVIAVELELGSHFLVVLNSESAHSFFFQPQSTPLSEKPPVMIQPTAPAAKVTNLTEFQYSISYPYYADSFPCCQGKHYPWVHGYFISYQYY